ncbi:hypothetical protein OROGR_007583 [Orobanche gracilis]
MSPSHFPLRWESTGDQWWYASPIDWAAANGHYDLVRELLRIDANHLIKLTSLSRIWRLETVWDDEQQFHDVAKCRSEVAKKLLVECETKKGNRSLIGAGYGGWLLYTAASAGDLGFVRELLDREPLLVFGEGEYGVTDILYAAARSKDPEVFKVVLDFAASPRRFSTTDLQQSRGGEVGIPSSCYKLEIMNRALHAAARGEIVVKYLSSSYSIIINSTDSRGNTVLHVAAHRGHLPIVETLIHASPSSIYATNNAGETFLHAVVAGFHTPGFQRLDRQIELLKHLLQGRLFDIKEIINAENNEGRTALHLAIMGNVHYDLQLELLMTIRGINININDANGMTPLGVLKRPAHSASSESQVPSPTAKKKLASGVMHEVMQAVPSFTAPHQSRSSSSSTLSLSSQSSLDPQNGASSCSKWNEISKALARRILQSDTSKDPAQLSKIIQEELAPKAKKSMFNLIGKVSAGRPISNAYT